MNQHDWMKGFVRWAALCLAAMLVFSSALAVEKKAEYDLGEDDEGPAITYPYPVLIGETMNVPDGINVYVSGSEEVLNIYSPVEGEIIGLYQENSPSRFWSLGNTVAIIESSTGTVFTFSHLDSLVIKKDKTVHIGTKIGKAGRSGMHSPIRDTPTVHIKVYKDLDAFNRYRADYRDDEGLYMGQSLYELFNGTFVKPYEGK